MRIFFKSHAAWFVCILLLFACRSRDRKHFVPYRIVIDKSEIADSIKDLSILSQIEFIPLQTTPGSVVSEVNKVVEYKGRYIVQDRHISSSVVSFDSTGKFLFSYGSKGEGPGQYILPMDFALDKENNELMVINSERRKINYYDLDNGSFKKARSYGFPARQVFKLKDNLMVFAGAARDKRIIFSDAKFSRKESFINYTERFGIMLINGLSQLNDSVLSFRLSFNDTVYRVSEDGVEPYMIVDFKENGLTEQFYNALSSPQRMRLGEYTTNKMTHLSVFTENGQTRLFSFNYNGHRYICVQDIHSGNKKIFRSDQFQDELFPGQSFNMVVGVDGQGRFLSLISAEKFIKASENNGRFLKQVEKLTPLSNPVLMRFKFKSF